MGRMGCDIWGKWVDGRNSNTCVSVLDRLTADKIGHGLGAVGAEWVLGGLGGLKEHGHVPVPVELTRRLACRRDVIGGCEVISTDGLNRVGPRGLERVDLVGCDGSGVEFLGRREWRRRRTLLLLSLAEELHRLRTQVEGGERRVELGLGRVEGVCCVEAGVGVCAHSAPTLREHSTQRYLPCEPTDDEQA